MGQKWTEERKQAAKEQYKAKMNYLHKVEDFNGETVPEVDETQSSVGNWSEDDKIASIINTLKILPPNMIENGRHKIENIQAINVFKITPELVDKAYSQFSHED